MNTYVLNGKDVSHEEYAKYWSRRPGGRSASRMKNSYSWTRKKT